MLFITIFVLCILAFMEVDIFIPSFPELIRLFKLTPFEVQLTLSVNFISYCISSLYVGSLGDRYGRRPLILCGLVIFLIGSAMCVWAPTFSWLVIGRFFQGIGMAGPAVLGFVVIADVTPLEKQAGRMGILNGMTTVGMAGAPILGSYINMYFGWRANFMILLILGIISLIMTLLFIPETGKPEPSVKVELKSYLSLLKSKEYRRYFYIFCLLITSHWTFVGMGPILYMESMGVPLQYFGFYQGAILVGFSATSLISPVVLRHMRREICLRLSSHLMMLAGVFIALISLGVKDTPWIITLIVSLYVIPFVFPINILYPVALSCIPDASSRAAALINFGRLIGSAAGLAGVSYLYAGTFRILALFMFTLTLVSYFLLFKTKEWRAT